MSARTSEYPAPVKDRHAADWEELARREPYFPVLSEEGRRGVDGNSVATPAFFETGEVDVAALLAAIAALIGREVPLTSTLDFGCGAGRLTLPLARRATTVVACDIAPTMLVHTRQNAQNAGLENITLIESDELSGLRAGQFDFICSLLVLQYIPPAAGYAIIRTLVSLLAPAGIAALQITFEKPGGRLRRYARATAGKSRPRLSYAQTAEYDERAVHRSIESAGARVIGRFATHQGDTAGAVLIIEKVPAPHSG